MALHKGCVMAGTISSLGIGSNVLTADVIEKLKANDESMMIKPLDRKIELEQQKGQALKLLDSLMSSFGSSVKSLADDTMFQKRTVSGNSDSVSMSVTSGVEVQDVTISDVKLAQKNILQSAKFTSPEDSIATGNGTMTLKVDGKEINIDYTSSMKLDDLRDAINEKASGSVKASIMQIGDGDYRLILSSEKTGVNQNIEIADSENGALVQMLKSNASEIEDLEHQIENESDESAKEALMQLLDTLKSNSLSTIQEASDASFKYNGITLTRSSNTIDDIVVGMSIELLQDSDKSTKLSVKQDVDAVATEMSNLVQSYNSLMKQLSDMTTANPENGTKGVFMGDSSFTSIGRDVMRTMMAMSPEGMSLAHFGIDLSEDGTMSFKESVFRDKFSADPVAAEKFFSSRNHENPSISEGIFVKLQETMERYTKYGGVLENLTNGSTNELKTLNENKSRTKALLDARYDTMTMRFAQYDSIISRLNNQFSSLNMQIQAAINGS